MVFKIGDRLIKIKAEGQQRDALSVRDGSLCTITGITTGTHRPCITVLWDLETNNLTHNGTATNWWVGYFELVDKNHIVELAKALPPYWSISAKDLPQKRAQKRKVSKENKTNG